MTDETEDLDPLLGRLSEDGRQRRDPEDHPSPEQLAAYQANELAPEEDDAIQEHLAECSLCTELLLDLQRFLETSSQPQITSGVAGFETAAHRRRRQASELDTTRAPRGYGSAMMAYALVAILAAGVIGLSIYVAFLRGQLRAPEGNSIAVFVPSQMGVRSEDTAEVIELPRGESKHLTLALGLPSKSLPYSEYQIGIRQWRGSEVLRLGGLKTQLNGVVFSVPSDVLEDGRYDITLWGVVGKASRSVGKYEIEIVRR